MLYPEGEGWGLGAVSDRKLQSAECEALLLIELQCLEQDGGFRSRLVWDRRSPLPSEVLLEKVQRAGSGSG